jgi:hypothetical protein
MGIESFSPATCRRILAGTFPVYGVHEEATAEGQSFQGESSENLMSDKKKFEVGVYHLKMPHLRV